MWRSAGAMSPKAKHRHEKKGFGNVPGGQAKALSTVTKVTTLLQLYKAPRSN